MIWLASKSDEMTWIPLYQLEKEFLPDKWLNMPKEILEAGHGGGDYMELQDFVDGAINGHELPVGIHEAMDMTLPGLISQESINLGSAWLTVPNSRARIISISAASL